ncbi:MAG: hypothetical protein AVDCRST_MAG62-6, partial [uncultured Sphingomonas sp.]
WSRSCRITPSYAIPMRRSWRQAALRLGAAEILFFKAQVNVCFGWKADI